MSKKVLLLSILSFLLCGCSVNYNLKIDKNLEEVTTISAKSSEKYQESNLTDYLHSFLDSNITSYFNPDNADAEMGSMVDGIEYYDIKNNDDGINVNGSFTLSDIYRSRVIKSCYNELSVQKNGDIYRINANDGCKAFDDYPLLDKVTIDLEIDYDVISSNADMVNNNHYIWELNSDNYESKNVSLVFSTKDLSNIDNKDDKEEDKEEKYNWANENPLLVILITFGSLFVALGIILFVYRKMR